MSDMCAALASGNPVALIAGGSGAAEIVSARWPARVVASAGYGIFDSLADGDPARRRHMVLTPGLGPALLIRAALPALRQTRGRIVLVGSVAGTAYTPGNIYRGDQVSGHRNGGEHPADVTGDGVGVTLINPGAAATSFWDAGGGLPDRPMLTADQLAAAIVRAISQPEGIDVNAVTIRPAGAPVA